MKQTQRDLAELKKHLRKGTLLLRTLKDDLRVELHLAGMEARTRLKQLAPRLMEVERLAKGVSTSSREAARRLTRS